MNESFRAQTWGYIPSDSNIGTIFDKALYKGYTGPDFETRTEQPEWLGFNGPVVRAEVGDMIEVMFVNRLGSYYAYVFFSRLGGVFCESPEKSFAGFAVYDADSRADLCILWDCFIRRRARGVFIIMGRLLMRRVMRCRQEAVLFINGELTLSEFLPKETRRWC
jgi:hypothetical protein